jgi:PGF-CTERM protein
MYSYKLEGYDGSWSAGTPDTSRSYSGLSNGDYTFKVKAKDQDDAVDQTPDERSFTVYVVSRGGGGGAPRDSDGDGYSDIEEMLAETNPNDPCDPNSECAACLAIRPPMPTPTPISTATPTSETTGTPLVPPAATPTPANEEEEMNTPVPGFGAVFAIAGLFVVAYLVRKRRKGE